MVLGRGFGTSPTLGQLIKAKIVVIIIRKGRVKVSKAHISESVRSWKVRNNLTSSAYSN